MNYFKLNLPRVPIKSSKLNRSVNNDVWNIYTDVEDILSDNLLECFEKLKAHPSTVVMFQSRTGVREVAHVHTDLDWKNNKWVKVPCAINWELQPIETTIKWYDTANCKEFWPNVAFDQAPYPFNYLNGINYTQKENLGGDPEGSVLIEEAKVNSAAPILFRTDIAHGVTFQSRAPDRFVASVRFSNITSWQHAQEIFKDIIVDNK